MTRRSKPYPGGVLRPAPRELASSTFSRLTNFGRLWLLDGARVTLVFLVGCCRSPTTSTTRAHAGDCGPGYRSVADGLLQDRLAADPNLAMDLIAPWCSTGCSTYLSQCDLHRAHRAVDADWADGGSRSGGSTPSRSSPLRRGLQRHLPVRDDELSAGVGLAMGLAAWIALESGRSSCG